MTEEGPKVPTKEEIEAAKRVLFEAGYAMDCIGDTEFLIPPYTKNICKKLRELADSIENLRHEHLYEGGPPKS